MWVFVMLVCLLDQNQAAPLPWEQDSLQLILQQQVAQTTLSPSPGVAPQRTSSSSSSSSSSSAESSESSQSSEGHQQLRERQRLENTAVEQLGSSQESSELLQAPTNTNNSLWLNELVSLGGRAGERDTGDDSVERDRHRALLMTFHPLLSRPQLTGPATEEGGAINEVGGVTPGVLDVGGVTGEEAELTQLLDDSTERADRLTFDSPGHAHHYDYHGNEAGLELSL